MSGANYYATSGSTLFVTADRDLYLPPEPANTLAAWAACESVGLELWSGREPLDQPRDLILAEAIVARQALVRASDGRGHEIDLTLVMAGFEFEQVWSETRVFSAEGVEIRWPVCDTSWSRRQPREDQGTACFSPLTRRRCASCCGRTSGREAEEGERAGVISSRACSFGWSRESS